MKKPPIRNGKVRISAKAKVDKKAEDLIEKGIEIFEDLNDKLNSKLDRAMELVSEIKTLCEEKGLPLEELEKATADSENLAIYTARFNRYLEEVKNEKASVEKKVALIGVMVDLSSVIGEVKPDIKE